MYLFKQLDNSSEGLEGLPVGIRSFVRILTVISGSLGILFGLITSITLSASCLFAGILMMVCGFIILAVEATFCCQFFTFASSARSLANYVERRPAWIRAIAYTIFSILPMLFCKSAWVFISFICTLTCAASYFMIAVGRKVGNSSPSETGNDTPWGVTVGSAQPAAPESTSDKAANDFWSNVRKPDEVPKFQTESERPVSHSYWG